MALYRLEAKIIGRNVSGKKRSAVAASAYRSAGKLRSVVAASAYRSGSKLQDEQTGTRHDYSQRKNGVIETVIVTPANAPEWTHDPSQLWNKVEAGEKRKDAQLAREFILAVPPELNDKEQFQLAVDWVNKDLVSQGMIAEVSLHHPKSGTNPHVHVMCTLRKLDGDNFSAKKSREWNENTLLCEWRKSWCDAENTALEKAGRPERVDHRSLKDRGIDRIPQPKIGKEAMGLKKRGVVADPERFKLVRWVKSLNAVMPWRRAIERDGEIQQHGMGETWWERSLMAVSDAGKTTRNTVADMWSKFMNRQPDRQDIEPDREPDIDITPDREPDMEL
jgi:hypothetical protein